MADAHNEPGDAPRLIRVLGPAARVAVARLPPADLKRLADADPTSLRRPLDAALSALTCQACVADDPAMGTRAGVFTLRFLALGDELAQADQALRATGVKIARATPEEDVLSALVELVRLSRQDLHAALLRAAAMVSSEAWTSSAVDDALRATVVRTERAPSDSDVELEISDDGSLDRTPAFGMPALAEGNWYETRVEVRRLDTTVSVPRGEIGLEIGNGLLALVDPATSSSFFADSIAAVANVVATQIAGGRDGVRLQFERPDRTVIIEIVPLTESSAVVAHAIALLAERARAAQ